MIRWFKSWWQIWKLARVAKEIIDDPEANSMASINARMIIAALAERKSVCRQCFNPYDPKTRQFAEMFQVRSILMIPDKELDPMLCDNCFETVVSTYNLQATNVGTSNSGPTNMVLQKLG